MHPPDQDSTCNRSYAHHEVLTRDLELETLF